MAYPQYGGMPPQQPGGLPTYPPGYAQPQTQQYGIAPAPTQMPGPAPTGAQARFGDLYGDATYQPKSAPKQEQEFPFTYRNSFEDGVVFIRFVAHPILLPNGFALSTYHSIPQSVGDPIACQCPESYDSEEPCYTCCLLQDLDDAKNNKHDSVLDAAHLGERAAKVLIENATMYCRGVLLPFLAKARVAMVPSKSGGDKTWRTLYPDPNSLCSGILSLKPDKPHKEYGSFPDKPFHRKLQLLTLTDQDLHRIYHEIAHHNPEEAQKFFAEASPIMRNPDLFDPQRGSWVAYSRGKQGQAMTMVCQPPSPLPPEVIAKYLNEKTYPNVKKFGSGGERGTSKRMSWWEQKACWEHSWVGQTLINQVGWDLNLDPQDWIEKSGPPSYQPVPPQQPNDIPF